MDGYIQKALPEPLLRDYIWQYTFVDMPFEQTQRLEFKVMPSSHTRMILFLGEPSLCETNNSMQAVNSYSLSGFTSKPQLFVPTSNLQQVMIHFTAWGIQPFVDFPISEITDSRADLKHIFKHELEDLCATLHKGLTMQEKVLALNHFFISRMRKARMVDKRAKMLAQYILQINGSVRLQDLAKKQLIGERTAQRLIHNSIGVNYKFFTKLVRLEFVRRLMTHENINLTNVAIQAGYFDQAHFIHDFQESFSESPRAYLKRRQKLIWNKIDED
ncbi:MAG: helix-turn-helix domain-containing protein [Bacteroidetes bacterium]|nr:helix-turn-helix domain-containing protein [Bacteroidota bacterium]